MAAGGVDYTGIGKFDGRTAMTEMDPCARWRRQQRLPVVLEQHEAKQNNFCRLEVVHKELVVRRLEL